MKIGPDLDALLALPLFTGVAPTDLQCVRHQLHVEQCRAGEHLFHRGDVGDALYIVLDGQVALEQAHDGGRQLVALCGSGDWFGELALLTPGPRAADARATVPTTLLRVSRTAWAELCLRSPRLYERLSRQLGRQLRLSSVPAPKARRHVVVCVDRDGVPPSWLAKLARSLARQFPHREIHALAADGTPVREEHCQRPATLGDARALRRAVAGVTAADAVILVPDAHVDVSADARLERVSELAWRLARARPDGRDERIRGVCEDDALDRVARHLARGTVGVALGAGGAYGLAHLGLLEVLHRARIPIDYVAGASIGAIVGAALASGVPMSCLVDFAEGLSERYGRIILRDLSPWGPALLAGNEVMRVLAELEPLRAATFDELHIPLNAVAMDLDSGEEAIIDEGPLLEGIRPSFAMPGLFPACHYQGRVLIDGAMVNPVPVDRVRALGADVVVASQPIPPLRADHSDPVAGAVRRAQWFADLVPVLRLRYGLDTLRTSLRSFQTLWFRLASAAALGADVVMAPDLGRFWFLQFGAAPEIIEAGRQSARALLPGIIETLDRRVGLRVGAGTG
jgi:predicted acylesterase/phospholipase RssA